jgi:hypothetical protein
MKALICGDRKWTDREKIRSRLSQLPPGSEIIEGGAPGADKLSRFEALKLDMKVTEFPAEWKKYGRAAGPIRNRKMLDEKPDLVIAFHPDLSQSRGTADTVREAKRRGIPVEVIS